jgi:hypothetical protein
VCRQWQFGEFRGENAGSAIKARLQVRVGSLDRYAPAGAPASAYDDRLPLEVRVEREPVGMPLAIRVQVGRHFLRLAGALWSGTVRSAYLARYAIEATADPATEPARDRLDPRAEPVAPAERPEASSEEAPAAAPADAPPVLEPAPSAAIAGEAQAHAPAAAPALEREP